MTAAYTPADQTNGLAAVGETIVFGVQSTNDGNVDVGGVTMLDTAGGLGGNDIPHVILYAGGTKVQICFSDILNHTGSACTFFPENCDR